MLQLGVLSCVCSCFLIRVHSKAFNHLRMNIPVTKPMVCISIPIISSPLSVYQAEVQTLSRD